MEAMKAVETVDALGMSERAWTWRDRFGWCIWWHNDWWVTQADSGAGSDKPRPLEDMDQRTPFTRIGLA